ncbi:MAG: hypothetical protein JWO84_671 [Parcubacteria group bacterium]|nr:hypothetical protein [Parcubacteria group bacterium]
MILQVGVKAVLFNKEGKILLVRRSEEKYGKTDGIWDIPGGRIDPGTSLDENLRRELQEEVQLDMLSEPHLVGAQDIMPDGERHVVRLTYVARADGEPVLDESENTEYRWVTPSELAELEDLDVFVKQLLVDGKIVL